MRDMYTRICAYMHKLSVSAVGVVLYGVLHSIDKLYRIQRA